MRLAKLLLALMLTAGSVFALTPGASAHVKTGSVAVVLGTVSWPASYNGTATAPSPGPALALGNGCAKEKGAAGNVANPAAGFGGSTYAGGVPLGNVADGLYTNPDLCFFFGPGILINSVGAWLGHDQKTSFHCNSNGITGASGNSLAPGTPLWPLTFGAFKGTFECPAAGNGPLVPGSGLPWVSASKGSFHGLSLLGGLAIGFLGGIECAPFGAPPVGFADPCTDPGGTPNPVVTTFPLGAGGWGPMPGTNHNTTGLKHTLSCKGNVAPLTLGSTFTGGTVPDTITSANVTLVCLIG